MDDSDLVALKFAETTLRLCRDVFVSRENYEFGANIHEISLLETRLVKVSTTLGKQFAGRYYDLGCKSLQE